MSDMTSRERVLAILRCQEPDRVPFLEAVVDEPVALALLGRPVPEGLVMGELGVRETPVFVGLPPGGGRSQQAFHRSL